MTDSDYLQMAVELARRNVSERGARPFGAVLVRNGEIVATGVNDVLATNDPTKHAELEAIRAAARALGNARLDEAIVYASGHPCPMCLAAMHMTGVKAAYYAFSNADADAYGLSSARIYAEMRKPLAQQSIRIEQLPLSLQGEHPYAIWQRVAHV
jgi:tRNA(Arg) A34 adenosine deaminase TadA